MPTDTTQTPASAHSLVGRRDKTTRRSVILIDKAADWTITVGGLGVIAAVFAIMLFLLVVVVPLFTGGSVTERHVGRYTPASGTVVLEKVDEYRRLAISVTSTGAVGAFHIPTGKALAGSPFDLGGATASAFGATLSGGDVVFGFADGTVRFGRLEVKTRVAPASEMPAGLVKLDAQDLTDGKSVYSPLPGQQVRILSVTSTLDAPQKIGDVPLVAIYYRTGGTVERPTRSFVTVDANGEVRLSRAETRVNMLTRKATTSVETADLPALPTGTVVSGVLMTDKADQVYVAERSGRMLRYDTRDFAKPTLAETIRLKPEGVGLTTLAFLIGEQSILAGGSDGSVDVYFRLQVQGARTTDGYTLVRSHRLESQGAPIVAIDVSRRTKMFVTADASGAVWLRHSTSEQTLLKLASDGQPLTIKAVAMAPRDDGVIALGDDGRYASWGVSVPHPETTLGSIFGPVWYEGYGGRDLTWQSSSGTDSFEPKFSLVPLIFGTLKSTFYAMLFAIPVALAAAIFTSEFLHHSVRAVVKPAMEMMASLPSVVLGFIAALILAPLVESWIVSVLLLFLLIPLCLIVSAYLWQMLPERVVLLYGGVPKFLLMFAGVIVGGWLSVAIGPTVEAGLFGDFKQWLSGRQGSSVGFMTIVLSPLMFFVAAWGLRRFAGAALDERMRAVPRLRGAVMDVGRWAALAAAGIFLAWIVASLLSSFGYDPRGGMVDTYVQRNTLVVGFAMGFAVIPIIYTIAEDALNSVPEHLRGASLACGATLWQTATRVILPTAASGVFAAVMIGMGRAVGETMIVVMAAGNTAIIDMNLFNGLRALSANIAVELPEAVRNDSLYRMLFLAALTLFVLTFIVNTLAEVVRQRFRRRAMSL
ncbi:MAG: ABC transporter permease subunit [Alphaproteobacteria bacterium]|nr:ABC transporter permease subunit [Alphaproteobacteria bacterium]MCW5741205.1 ABC transporter permease subunit [Alphaproteobacteria bacterium]